MNYRSGSVAFVGACVLLGAVVQVPLVQAQAAADAAMPRIYSASEVDQHARRIADGIEPAYPDSLRPLGIDGKVLAQFVVDTMGLVDTTSILTEAYGQPLFAASVRHALTTMHFSVAKKGGRKVAEEILESFVFRPEPPPKPDADSMRGKFGPKLDGGRAAIAPGSPTPNYPDEARRLGFQGEVHAQFVIDSTGAADPKTIRIVSVRVWRNTPGPLPKPPTLTVLPQYDELDAKREFADAVARVLPRMRFVPVLRDGAKVRQLGSQVFTFTLAQ